ncbi:MAG: glycosyltransferase [Bacteroidales bacterium]|nr:glycosyltransferase [Bacteroidales bacterium]
MKTPILLITFNRPDHVRRVLTEIRKQKPTELYVCQDGAREGNENDKIKCQEVRDVIKELVDWSCNLHTLYQEKNLGCGLGPAAGISWFFEHVELGIVMEDDCLPHPDFFNYCEELLEHYKNDKKVLFINSTLYDNRWQCEASYGFSHYMVTGAWAAKRETWHGFDLDLNTLNAWSFRKQVLRITHNRAEANWWYFKVKEIQKDTDKKSYWDYQMQIHLFRSNALTIHPRVNLISNIGFDAEGTHTLKDDGRGDKPVYPILPLQHPDSFDVDTKMDAICFAKRQSRGWIMDTLSFIKHTVQ